MIWSHCGFQGVPPSSTFLMSIGVGGTGRIACAREGVPIPMHSARLAIAHHLLSTGIPSFSIRHETRFRRHGWSMAELSQSKPSNVAHSVTNYRNLAVK